MLDVALRAEHERLRGGARRQPGERWVVIECSQESRSGPGHGDHAAVGEVDGGEALDRAAAARASGRRSARPRRRRDPRPRPRRAWQQRARDGARPASRQAGLLSRACSHTTRGSPCVSHRPQSRSGSRDSPTNPSAVAIALSKTTPQPQADEVDVVGVVGQVVGRRAVVEVGVGDDARCASRASRLR